MRSSRDRSSSSRTTRGSTGRSSSGCCRPRARGPGYARARRFRGPRSASRARRCFACSAPTRSTPGTGTVRSRTVRRGCGCSLSASRSRVPLVRRGGVQAAFRSSPRDWGVRSDRENPVIVGNRRAPVYKPAVLGDFVPDNPAIIYLRCDGSERGFSGAARAPCASSATPASPPPRGAKSPTASSTRSARPVASAQSSRESRTRGPGALVGSPVLCLRPGHSHGCRRQSPCPSKRIVDVDPGANSQCCPCQR